MPEGKVNDLSVDELREAIYAELHTLQRLTANPKPFYKILNDVSTILQRVTFRLAFPADRDDDDEEE